MYDFVLPERNRFQMRLEAIEIGGRERLEDLVLSGSRRRTSSGAFRKLKHAIYSSPAQEKLVCRGSARSKYRQAYDSVHYKLVTQRVAALAAMPLVFQHLMSSAASADPVDTLYAVARISALFSFAAAITMAATSRHSFRRKEEFVREVEPPPAHAQRRRRLSLSTLDPRNRLSRLKATTGGRVA
jgi:hypothetical protein